MSKNDDQGRLPPPETTTPALREGERFPDPIEALTSGCEIACNVAPVRGAYRVEG